MTRKALRPTPITLPSSAPFTLPAPTGGLNTRDDRANLPPSDAELMDNWYPETTDVRVRPGSATYASGLPGQCESILSYTNGSTLRLFVTCAGTFQNIGTTGLSGTITNATVTGMTGFTNNRWQYRNIGTPGGHFLTAVNGADARQIYDGSVWFAGSTYSTGTIGTFTNVEIFQRRLYFTELNTLRFIYLVTPDAIGGTASAFDLGSLMDMGGYLTAIGTWTRDGGSGMDDVIAFISNYGQIAVYSGIDPSSSTTWTLIGVYKSPYPVSARCFQKFGGELLIGTTTGVVPMSVVVSGLVQQSPQTDKIKTSINDAWAVYQNNFGWELKYFSPLNWLIFNVPVSTNAFQQQYIMNVQTGAWCRFRDWQANTFESHNGNLYFGTTGKVIQAGTGQSDDGAAISYDVKQAANVFGAPGRQKQSKIFRPLINSDGTLSAAYAMNWDFMDVIPTNVPTPSNPSIAVWDVATWDDYFWGDDTVPTGVWQSCPGFGTYGSIRIRGSSLNTAVRWYGTDLVLEAGGML